jgi:HD-GYP domain-containing protein (c-di-GMP phosphodiesterase class II)
MHLRSQQKSQNDTYPSQPFTLKFLDASLERAYRTSVYDQNLIQIRTVFILFSTVYSLFGLLDSRLGVSDLNTFLIIRYGVVVPLFLIIIGLTFTKLFFQWQQWILFSAFLIGGIGIDIMLILEPMNLTYYAGLFMIFFSGFFIIRLDFYLSAIAGTVVFLFFFIVTWLVNGWLGVHFVSASTFYVISLAIGMMGSYFVDYHTRRNFVLNLQIEADKAELEKRVQHQVVEITQAQNATILALAKLAESRDTDTGEHVARVGMYCRVVAEGLDMKAEEEMPMSRPHFIDIISSASYLHDIGKVGIKDHILNKPEALTPEEFDVIKMHTVIGYQTLLVVQQKTPDNQFIQMGLEIVRSHHERWDGKGYPDGLSGKEIPLSARIMAVVDVYDAIRSRRPYKPPLSHENAIKEILQESGTHFDPMVVYAFLKRSDELSALSEDYQVKSLNLSQIL